MQGELFEKSSPLHPLQKLLHKGQKGSRQFADRRASKSFHQPVILSESNFHRASSEVKAQGVAAAGSLNEFRWLTTANVTFLSHLAICPFFCYNRKKPTERSVLI